jgi:hypothetical protein
MAQAGTTPSVAARDVDLHGANCDGNFGTVLGVVIQDEKLGCWFVGKGFAQLLHDPGATRMACNVEVKNTPPIVADYEENIKHPKRHSRGTEKKSMAAMASR